MASRHQGSRMRLFAAAGLAVLLAGFVILHGAPPAPKQPYTTWSDYGGGADGMQYSALKQINKKNVSQLELAWFYQVPGPTNRFGFNPVIVDGLMYVMGKESAMVALDAVTGKEVWSHPVRDAPPTAASITGRARTAPTAGSCSWPVISCKPLTRVPALPSSRLAKTASSSSRRRYPRANPTGTPGHIFEDLIMLGSVTGEGLRFLPGLPSRV